MTAIEQSDGRQRLVAARELVSATLMILPMLGLVAFLWVIPSVWTTPLASYFSGEGEVQRRDPGWVIAGVAVVACSLSAAIGLLGLRESWKVNRRWQRGLVGSIAAVLLSVLFGTWGLTQELDAGRAPDVGLAMFATMCSALFGVVVAAVTPRDSLANWQDPDPDPDSDSGAGAGA